MVAGRKAKMFPNAGMWVDVLKEVRRNCFLLPLFFFPSETGSKVILKVTVGEED